MSAIWGIVTLDEKENIPEHAKEIFESVYQKCKIDCCRSINLSGAYLGCGVQHITPQSKGEKLPLVDEEKEIVFTADCILDNRAEVIDMLVKWGYDGQQLSEQPDGGLMYAAYQKLGTECVKYFRGLFSIAIWDGRKKILTLLSDRVAARCLYYVQRGNLIAFSTIMKPLLKLFPELASNVDYNKDFLLVNPSVIYVMPGETPYQEISLMLPGAEAEFSPAGRKKRSYWTIGEAMPGEELGLKFCRSPKDYSRRFMEIYEDCVRDALVSNGEVGIAMSSGLDSASVGVLAAKELAKSDKTLHCYTFVPYEKIEHQPTGNLVYDESAHVKEIAEKYPNMRTEFLNNRGRNIFEDMDACMELLEMPYKTGTFPNHHEMCREGAKVGCKVFLNGGFGNNTVSYGDMKHIFYHLYKKKRFVTLLLWLNHYCRHESLGRKKMTKQLLGNYRTFDKGKRKAEKIGDGGMLTDTGKVPVPDNYYLQPSILKNYDWKRRFSEDKRLMLSRGYIDGESYENHLKASALLTYLGVFETKFGLDTGMVLRDPTKDVRMLAFCHELPYHLFAYKGMTRWLVRNSFRELLPESVLGRWCQRGLLNIDWVERIYRDWEWIKPRLLEDLETNCMDEWFDKERMKEDIACFGKNKNRDKYAITHIYAIDALLRFRKMKEEQDVL